MGVIAEYAVDTEHYLNLKGRCESLIKTLSEYGD